MKKKTIDKAEFLKSINRDIKIYKRDFKECGKEVFSYMAGQINMAEWIRDWVKADLGDV